MNTDELLPCPWNEPDCKVRRFFRDGQDIVCCDIHTNWFSPEKWNTRHSKPVEADADSVTHLYEWLAPKLSTQERNALDAIYAAVKHHERSEQVQDNPFRRCSECGFEYGHQAGCKYQFSTTPPEKERVQGVGDLPGGLALSLSVQKGEWPHTMDAAIWANNFIKAAEKDRRIATDFGVMVGWFANAIMAGHDTALMRAKERAPSLPEGYVSVSVEQLKRWKENIDPFWFSSDGESDFNNEGVIDTSNEISELLLAARPTPAQEETK